MITGAAFILRWSCWLLQNSLFCESWPCLLLAWLIVWSVQSMGGVSQLPLNRLLRLSDTEMAAIVRLTTTQRKSLNCDNYHYSALFLWGTVYQLLRTSKSEGRNYLEDEILSIFVWELVIGPTEVTLVQADLNPRVRCAFGNVLKLKRNLIFHFPFKTVIF